MKTLFLLGLIIISYTSFAQKTQASGQKPSNSQLKEMEDAIKEMEKVNPEAAKAMKKSLNQMDNHQKPQPAVTKSTTSKFVSPRVKVPVKVPIVPPKPGQEKDRLLWAKGTKLNENLLVNSNGTLVWFRRDKNQVIIQPDPKKDPFEKVIKALAQHEKFKDDFLKAVDNDSHAYLYFPAVLNTLRELDVMHEAYMEAANNVVDLKSLPGDSAELKADTAKKIKKKTDADITDLMRRKYQEVKEIMKNYPPLEFPPPPARDLDACFRCDSNRLTAYEAAETIWMQKFYEYEAKLNGKAILVLRQLDGFEGPESTKMMADMDWARDMAMNRISHKLDLLSKNYGEDFRYVNAIIHQYLDVTRKQLLFGLSEERVEAVFTKMINYIKKFEDYIEKQMSGDDYTAFLGIFQYMSLMRQRQLLGESEDQQSIFNLLTNIEKFNRFIIKVNIDFAIASDDLKATGKLVPDGDFYAQLVPVKCKFVLTPLKVDKESGDEKQFYIPLKATAGDKEQKEEDDKWVHYGYSGPRELMMLFPKTVVGFCEDQPDTILFSIIRYRVENYADYMGAFPKAYTIDFAGYANLILINVEGAEASATAAMEIAGKMMEINSLNVSSYKAPILNKLATAYEKFVRMTEMQQNMNDLVMSNKVQIEFTANRSGKEFFSVETNATRSGDPSVTKGLITVQVIHDPIRQ